MLRNGGINVDDDDDSPGRLEGSEDRDWETLPQFIFSTSACIGTILLFPRFTYLMRGVKSISSLVLLLYEVIDDIYPFAAVTVVFLAVMGYALALLSPRNGSGLSHSTDGFFVSVYLTLLGDFDRDEDANIAQMVVFFVFTAVSNIVLLNALIAIISKSYDVAQARHQYPCGR